MIIEEGDLKFNFSELFDVIKFDDSHYYRNHFEKIQQGIKAIDILALKENENYMIEVKDYRHPDTAPLNQIQLVEDIIKKFIFSISAMYPMSYIVTQNQEQQIAKKFLENRILYLILHIEIPPQRRNLRQSNYNISNLQLELRRKLHAITNKTNIKVVSKDNLKNLPWSLLL